MLNANNMAQSIHDAMGFPGTPSNTLVAWSSGVITELTTACQVNNAPGTVLGTAPPSGGPLAGGYASNGLMSGMSSSSLANNIAASVPEYGGSVTNELQKYCDAIVEHIQSMGRVEFASGTITGVCTNTLTNPGTFTGSGANGIITLLDGPTLANLVASKLSLSPVTDKLLNMCTAIVTYIMSNAQVNYSSATGTCSAGGGPLIAGAASGGTII